MRNLWLLMLYAADLARWRDRVRGMVEDDLDEIPDLVAHLLSDTVERRMRRDLTRGYVDRERVLHRVRGRIDVLRTEARWLLSRGQVHCRFTESTFDSPRNRLVRVALDRMAGIVSGADLAHRCRVLANELGRAGVAGVRPSRADLAADQFGRNDDDDRLMVALAALAFDLAVPTEEEGGNTAILEPEREERWVRTLFEKAVLGFSRWELEPLGWTVGGGNLSWRVAEASPGMMAILPTMRLDVLIRTSEGRRLIIDTKFAAVLRPGRWGKERLSSGYLYQMFAYLRARDDRDDDWRTASGLLLHPAVGITLHEWAMIQGHAIHVAAVDLTASTAVVRTALRDAIVVAAQGAPSMSSISGGEVPE